MKEQKFVDEMEKRGYNIDCQNGEDLIVMKNNEVVAKVNSFYPLKMNTISAPQDILGIIVEFSSTKYEDRF